MTTPDHEPLTVRLQLAVHAGAHTDLETWTRQAEFIRPESVGEPIILRREASTVFGVSITQYTFPVESWDPTARLLVCRPFRTEIGSNLLRDLPQWGYTRESAPTLGEDILRGDIITWQHGNVTRRARVEHVREDEERHDRKIIVRNLLASGKEGARAELWQRVARPSIEVRAEEGASA